MSEGSRDIYEVGKYLVEHCISPKCRFVAVTGQREKGSEREWREGEREKEKRTRRKGKFNMCSTCPAKAQEKETRARLAYLDELILCPFKCSSSSSWTSPASASPPFRHVFFLFSSLLFSLFSWIFIYALFARCTSFSVI